MGFGRALSMRRRRTTSTSRVAKLKAVYLHCNFSENLLAGVNLLHNAGVLNTLKLFKFVSFVLLPFSTPFYLKSLIAYPKGSFERF